VSSDDIRPTKEQVEKDFLSRPGVNGVAIGFKYVNGSPTEELAIRVLVQKKQAVPADQAIPPVVNGIKTDVIEATPQLLARTPGQIRPFHPKKTDDPHDPFDPLIGGIDIGLCRTLQGGTNEGTLGATSGRGK
jgi:hypothetical protein